MDRVHVVYSLQDYPDPKTPSLFLAGPTPRKATVQSWRPKALKMIERYCQELVVYVPEQNQDPNPDQDPDAIQEPEPLNKWSPDREEHIIWNRGALIRSRVILFWVDRHLKNMPGFRTNTEWGFWTGHDPSKLVLAFPKKASGMRGMNNDAHCYNIPTAHSLSRGIDIALEKIFSTH